MHECNFRAESNRAIFVQKGTKPVSAGRGEGTGSWRAVARMIDAEHRDPDCIDLHENNPSYCQPNKRGERSNSQLPRAAAVNF
jgi:hypothetical protein